MEKELNPTESLELIQQTIREAKGRFQENGHVYIFWGTLTLVCALSQFLLEELEIPYPFLVWLLTIPGGIYTSRFYLRRKKGRKGKNVIASILMVTGFLFGANIFILGFAFWPYLGESYSPIVVVLLSLYAMVVARALQFEQMFYIGLATNLLGFCLFFVDLHYQSLGVGLAGICLLLIPGILLNQMNKKRTKT